MYKIKKTSFIHFFKYYCSIIIISALSYVMYIFQIQQLNEYTGMKPIPLSREDILLFFLFSFLIALFMPKKTTPSNIFVGIYLIFVVMCNVALSKVSGKLTTFEIIFKFTILYVPIILFYIIKFIFYKNILFRIKFKYIKSKNFNIYFLVFLLMIAGVVGYHLMGGGSFDFENSYVRRLSSRKVFSSGTISAYLYFMSVNGIAPILAFIGAYQKNFFYVLIAFAFSIFSFWLIGTKAPIFYVMLMIFMGSFVKKNREDSILSFILYLLLLINMLAVIEYLIFDFSIISTLYIRRAVATVAQNQSYYIDFFLNNNSILNNFFGIQSNKQITYLIGDIYLNNVEINANTNTFLYELLQNGMIGFILSIFVVSIFFLMLDLFYEKYQYKEILSVAFLYSLLITEQSYSTAFVTSGIGLVFIMLVFFRNKVSHLIIKA